MRLAGIRRPKDGRDAANGARWPASCLSFEHVRKIMFWFRRARSTRGGDCSCKEWPTGPAGFCEVHILQPPDVLGVNPIDLAAVRLNLVWTYDGAGEATAGALRADAGTDAPRGWALICP